MRLGLALLVLVSPLQAANVAPRVVAPSVGTVPQVHVGPLTGGLQSGLSAPILAPRLDALTPATALLPAPQLAPAPAPLSAAPAAAADAPQAAAAAVSPLSALQAVAPQAADAAAEGPRGEKAAAAIGSLYTGEAAHAGSAVDAPSGASYSPAESLSAAVARWVGPVPPGDARSPMVRRRVAELKHVLGDAHLPGKSMAWSVSFGKGKDAEPARGAGLEGFLWSKLEHEAAHPRATPLIGDYFRHVHTLLGAAPWAKDLREHVDALGRSHRSVAEKNERLNELLLAATGVLRGQLRALDPALAARQNATYTVLARAYNREKPGQTFFDSLDAAELARIKALGANDIWLMDVFAIGETKRWGTGGGSPYSLKGYSVKPELGGDAGLAAFAARAKAAGLRVKLDFVPNHSSLDAPRLKEHPEDYLTVTPPQNLSDEAIMASVPLERGPGSAPVYALVRTADGKRVLVHHPRTGTGGEGSATWVDMAQYDLTRPSSRARLVAELTGLMRRFGADSVRRDMAYELLTGRYHDRWTRILKAEIAVTPEGWMKQRSQALLDGFTKRWKALKHEEILAVLSDAAKDLDPAATLIDEAHGALGELSRAGSDGAYNNAFDAKRGKVGVYDALRSGEPARIREALRHAAFRRWQVGGAAGVNYIGTHEEFEGNPVDVFGPRYRAAAATALLLRPILLFNGFEQGVGQARNVIGDLSKSQDTGKALPFDVPVKLDWDQRDGANADFLSKLLAIGEKHKDLLDRGVMDVLTPADESSTAAVYTASNGRGAALLVAANHGGRKSHDTFRFDSGLAPLGAFRPKAGAVYELKDVLNGGRARTVTGEQLLSDGLALSVPGYGAQVFEVTLRAEGGQAPATPPSDEPRAAAAPAAPGPLNVWIAAGESVPFIKTGGLADVIDALGRGLAKAGQKSTVVLPYYAELKLPAGASVERVPGAFAVRVNGRVETARLRRAELAGVTFLFIEHDYYFAREGAYYGKNVDYTDNDERFVFFAAAAMEAARFLDERPDVFHAHDWQAALIAPMLDALKASDPWFALTKSVLTIHNMAYQGRFSRETLKKAGLAAAKFPAKRGRWGFNVMDAALRTADAVTTVSNTYKDEIQTAKFGEELDERLRERAKAGELHGIVNGLDTLLYDPSTDPNVAAHYAIEDAGAGKAANKLALQAQLGLPQDANVPLFAIGSRFVRQKGLDLIGSIVPLLAQRGAQLVIVGAGNGEEAIEKELAELAALYPDTLKLHGFSETFVRLAYAASDFLFMPSRFEPCGLSQLIAQRYGSLPIVTRTGGLADTVTDLRADEEKGDGLFIAEFSPRALEDAVLAALSLYSDQARLARHRRIAMEKDSSWEPAIARYLALYRGLK